MLYDFTHTPSKRCATETDPLAEEPAAVHLQNGKVEIENSWRCPPQVTNNTIAPDRIVVSRWTGNHGEARTVTHAGDSRWHCISLTLRSSADIRFSCDGKPIVEGRLTVGTAHITAPSLPTSATFTGAYDVLHLFVPNEVIAACYADHFGRSAEEPVILDDLEVYLDPALVRLAQALAVANDHNAAMDKIFSESIATAIVSRAAASYFARSICKPRAHSRLPTWRLRRALDYIDANLGSPIGLNEIAESTGLSRMHFATQFRHTTGLRPHEYLLRRRIEQSQHLLRNPDVRVLDIALRCGFRSQSHFTTVFKRFVGKTPHNWRMQAIEP